MNAADIADLGEAVALLRRLAHAAMDVPGERWMADQSVDYGLVVGCYGPDDVDDDGVISTGCIAYLSYPGDEEHRAHGRALPAAAHMAGLDPAVALELADWMGSLHDEIKAAGGNLDACDYPGEVQRAVRLAQVYLRKGP